jgi:hypothetical protein
LNFLNFISLSLKEESPAKALVAQRKNAKALNATCSWRASLCAFAGKLKLEEPDNAKSENFAPSYLQSPQSGLISLSASWSEKRPGAKFDDRL